jgi:hypothetical protein
MGASSRADAIELRISAAATHNLHLGENKVVIESGAAINSITA